MEFESKISAALTSVWKRFFRRAKNEMSAELPIPGDEFWSDLRNEQIEAIKPIFDEIIAAGIDDAKRPVQIVIDYNLVNSDAARWARQYEYSLITGITDTTKRAMQNEVGQWVERGEEFKELVKRIDGVFNDPIRAQMIAATEATRVYARANSETWAAQGVQPALYIPPAHPRCRCYLQPKRLPNGNEVIVWYTARDELVCDQPLKTPWGEIAGCGGMHKRVVSGGEYGGMTLDEAVIRARGTL